MAIKKNQYDQYTDYLNQQPKSTDSQTQAWTAQNGTKQNSYQQLMAGGQNANGANGSKHDSFLAIMAGGQNNPNGTATGTQTPQAPKPTWNASDNAWYQQAQSLMDQINNRQPFTFDLNANALYQQYKDQYMKQGQQAMMDTMGQAAALTGGYGSSYGQAVGNQAYNEYLTKLGNIVPDLYAQERAAYDQEGQDLYNRLNAAQGMYATDYGAYRDQMADYQWEEQFGLQKQQFQASLDQWAAEFGLDQAKFQAALDQWAQEFEYGKQRDAVSDDHWEREFGFSREQWEQSVSQWAQEFGLSREQFQEAVRQYEQNRTDNNMQSNRQMVMQMLSSGYMPSAEELQAAGISQSYAQYLVNRYAAAQAPAQGSTGGTNPGYVPGYVPQGDQTDTDPTNTNPNSQTQYGPGLDNSTYNGVRQTIYYALGSGNYQAGMDAFDQVSAQLDEGQYNSLLTMIQEWLQNHPNGGGSSGTVPKPGNNHGGTQ